MFERILLPLDGSTLAEASLVQISQLLRLPDSELFLLRVPQPTTVIKKEIGAPPGKDASRGEAEAYLARIHRRLADREGRVRSLVEDGSPAGTILDTAERENATLIVMTTHGRTGLPRWVFGSVTEKVIRASVVPLLLLRSFPPSEPSRTPSFERILVPISHFNLRILPYVKEFARVFGARAILLHVTEATEDEGMKDRARNELNVVAEQLRGAGVNAEVRERPGDAAHEILNSSWEESAGLIAITTHGSREPSRWALGSVTEKVLRSATTPILLVRNL
jgi:nucleotide-binding universal stress UspA family protein